MPAASFNHRFVDHRGVEYWVHARRMADPDGKGRVSGLCVCTVLRVLPPPPTIMVNPASNASAFHVAVDDPEIAAQAMELCVSNGLCVSRWIERRRVNIPQLVERRRRPYDFPR